MESPELLEFKKDRKPCIFCGEDEFLELNSIMPKGRESERISICHKCIDKVVHDLMWFVDAECVEKELKKLYPSWCQLANKDKEIVSNIARQIPTISIEVVASIFISHNLDSDATIDYIKKEYYGNSYNKCEQKTTNELSK